MLTIPIQPAALSGSRNAATKSILILGRSETVLTETVELLRNHGRVVGATNDFANVLRQFDLSALGIVVFGGMVSPAIKASLRTTLTAANPAITFVQGLAGIPGLLAAQVQAALSPTRRHLGSIDYDADGRTVTITLQSAESVRVTGFWHTAFVAPDPESTSEIIFDATMDAGTHTLPLPGSIPTAASFIAVHVGTEMRPFVVGAMPRGTTMSAAPA